MKYEKEIVIEILRSIRNAAQLYYAQFTAINQAIIFLEGEDLEKEEEPPYFQITVRGKHTATHYLTFSHEGFQMKTYFHDGDNSMDGTDIELDYETGRREGNEGSAEKWQEDINDLLRTYAVEMEEHEESDMVIYFSEDY